MRYKPFIFLLLLFFTACKKQPQWDIDGYLPLLKSNLYLQNALEDSLKSVGSDGELNLVYNSNLFSLKIDSLFTIPDTTITEYFNLPIGGITFVPGQTIVNDTQTNIYDLQDIELRYVIVRSGGMSLELQSTLSEDAIFTYSLPYITLNGVPFSVTETVPAGSVSSPSSITSSFDLAGYEIDLKGLNQNSYNTLIYTYKATVDPNGSSVTVSTADFVKINTTFNELIPEYASGYFGNRIETDASTDSLGIFNNFQGGSLDLEEAELVMTVNNEAGADIQLKINELTSINDYTGNTVSLVDDIIGGSINLSRATEGGSNYPPIQSQNYTVTLDDNSNLDEFIGNLPTQMGYNMQVQLNPLGNVSNGNDFIYYNTGLEIALDAEIPLNFSATNLILLDTTGIDIDPDSKEDVDPIQGGKILVYANNYYPIDAYLQFYLMDSNLVVVDSLFDEPQYLQSGIPNSIGKVLTPTKSTLVAPLSTLKIDHLYQTYFTEIHATISTTNQTTKYQIYDSYKIGLEVVGDFTYRVEKRY